MSDDTPDTQRISADPFAEQSIEPAGFGDSGSIEAEAGTPASPRAGLSWVALSVLIVAVLFCFGQLGLILPLEFPAADTRSRMKADYNLWPEVALQPVSAGVIEDIRRNNPELNGTLVAPGEYWGSPTVFVPLPTLTPSPTPSSIPVVAQVAAATVTPPRRLNTPVFPPTATLLQNQPTPRPTRTNPPRSRLPTSTLRASSTSSVRIATDTPRPRYQSPTPTKTYTRTPTSTSTKTPTRTFTATWTATITLTPSNTPTTTPSNTPTPSRTPTPSNTPTITRTPTLTGTPTFTPTPTPTKTPVGNIGEGTPDATWEPIPCGEMRVIDFGEPRPIDSIVFYEFYNPGDGCANGMGGGICLDELQVWLSNTPPQATPPVHLEGTQVFFWGDDNTDNNGYVFPYHHRTDDVTEIDNEGIPSIELFPTYEPTPLYRTGVCIALPENRSYRYLTFYAPYNPPPAGECNDQGEIDAFEINVNLDYCPVPTSTSTQAQPAAAHFAGPR